MITKIIATSDLHIRNYKRMDETKEQFEKFLDDARKIVEENGKENTRIVIAGDLVHSKLTIASECYLMLSWFLHELNDICKTIVIAGNHDLNTPWTTSPTASIWGRLMVSLYFSTPLMLT